ncbi:calponin homology domain protein [Aspergillus mulundensis]|uniref:Calponin-homology (CH) domain-containing protein n=1 Tax=Aspergillus mulundensis TaxID=1810919 RepID=A0A3D8S4E2_9EURO|nr:Uncharacterized protein DSM5745_04692 [Aspergillus mulundensis]RDW81135.1 Uncharacterized protein DSM5745_04692 [Aspergillus mulundensis]
MASVSSLDKDLRNLRLSRYTPQAAAEVRSWIEEVLRERLAPGDLLEALKDGVALCKLLNLAVSPGVKYKQSSMPFVQMENISHFLRACQLPPLSLPPHDVFLTVDLYEAKDPAQVLQCISAFSRRANAIQPGKFPRAIGVQSKAGTLSPSLTGSSQGPHTPTRNRFGDANSNASGRSSPAKSPQTVSSWSKKSDHQVTQPAWNIHQYGYMGGASQANQGVAFGARRQITTAAPHVPSVAEKENRRREEEERLRLEQEEAERIRRQQREAEEARAREEEEHRWAEETSRLREKERRDVEEERRLWDEEQRRWEQEEQQRLREEKEAEERFENERQRRKDTNDIRLTGQFLSQYRATQAAPTQPTPIESQESQRVKELEQQLELAKEREREYERERQVFKENDNKPTETKRPVPPKPSYDLSSLEQERRLLRGEWERHQAPESVAEMQTPPPMPPRRPLPDPASAAQPPKPQASESRVDRFLSSNPAPVAPKPATHRFQDYTTTSEVDAENSRRLASQQKTRAGGWASKSLLEREMERERERQREWEESQKQTQEAAARGVKDPSLNAGPGGAWDVHQYGFMGGDNQNRGGPGLGIGGARRQIIGPRPPT